MLNLTVKEVKTDEDCYYLLVDNNDCVCGIHDTSEEASRVLVAVQENINRGRLHRRCMREIKERFNIIKKLSRKRK